MTDSIKDRLRQHYNELVKYMKNNEHLIFGIFLYGSQNYGIDTPDSDVDTKAVVLPSLEDIALNKRPISIEHQIENGEHINITDFRLWMEQLRKQNINILEVLFTEYYIINPKYKEIWQEMILHREEIAHYDIKKAIASACGITLSKYDYINNKYPSNAELIDRFGYDPKSLASLFRSYDFLKRYLEDITFEQCLIPTNKEWIKQIKEGKVFGILEATQEADRLRGLTMDLREDFLENSSKYPVREECGRIEEMMNKWSISAIKISLGINN